MRFFIVALALMAMFSTASDTVTEPTSDPETCENFDGRAGATPEEKCVAMSGCCFNSGDSTCGTCVSPTSIPSVIPTTIPFLEPTSIPSIQPTSVPHLTDSSPDSPSMIPTTIPFIEPTSVPSVVPTMIPTTFCTKCAMDYVGAGGCTDESVDVPTECAACGEEAQALCEESLYELCDDCMSFVTSYADCQTTAISNSVCTEGDEDCVEDECFAHYALYYNCILNGAGEDTCLSECPSCDEESKANYACIAPLVADGAKCDGMDNQNRDESGNSELEKCLLEDCGSLYEAMELCYLSNCNSMDHQCSDGHDDREGDTSEERCLAMTGCCYSSDSDDCAWCDTEECTGDDNSAFADYTSTEPLYASFTKCEDIPQEYLEAACSDQGVQTYCCATCGSGDEDQDVDVCGVSDDCDDNATCTETDVEGGFTCACLTGYDGDGKTCTINCEENPHAALFADCTHSGGTVCAAGKFYYDSLCQDSGKVCTNANTDAITAACLAASGSVCAVDKFYYGDSCQSTAKSCVANPTTALDATCMAADGTTVCSVNQYYYDNVCNDNGKSCVNDNTAVLTEACMDLVGTTATCAIDQYHYDDNCQTDAKACVEDTTTQLTEKCVAPDDSVCTVDQYFYRSACHTTPLACVASSNVIETKCDVNGVVCDAGKFYLDGENGGCLDGCSASNTVALTTDFCACGSGACAKDAYCWLVLECNAKSKKNAEVSYSQDYTGLAPADCPALADDLEALHATVLGVDADDVNGSCETQRRMRRRLTDSTVNYGVATEDSSSAGGISSTVSGSSFTADLQTEANNDPDLSGATVGDASAPETVIYCEPDNVTPITEACDDRNGNTCPVDGFFYDGACQTAAKVCAVDNVTPLADPCVNSGGVVCARYKYFYGDACQDNKKSCSVNNVVATGEACDCSGNECSAAQYCYDGLCNDDKKDCDEQNVLVTDEICMCGTDQCTTTEFCYTLSTNTCEEAAKVCAESTVNQLGERCMCGGANCMPTQYCYDGTCMSVGKACSEDTVTVLTEACVTAGGATCAVGSFYYDGACETSAKACVAAVVTSITEKCDDGSGNTCVVGQFFYDGVCNNSAKACADSANINALSEQCKEGVAICQVGEYVYSGACQSSAQKCNTGGAETCDSNATCADTSTGFSCTCNSGFTGNGNLCVDSNNLVDECATDADDCDANATCTDTFDSFTCACNSGYSGDGKTCTDTNECTSNTDNCDANATCTNTVGSFTCACNSGYTGDGTTCTDTNECTDGSHDCDENATCTNTAGGFTCACNTSYAGNGKICARLDDCSASNTAAVESQCNCGDQGACAVGRFCWLVLTCNDKSKKNAAVTFSMTYEGVPPDQCATHLAALTAATQSAINFANSEMESQCASSRRQLSRRLSTSSTVDYTVRTEDSTAATTVANRVSDASFQNDVQTNINADSTLSSVTASAATTPVVTVYCEPNDTTAITEECDDGTGSGTKCAVGAFFYDGSCQVGAKGKSDSSSDDAMPAWVWVLIAVGICLFCVCIIAVVVMMNMKDDEYHNFDDNSDGYIKRVSTGGDGETPRIEIAVRSVSGRGTMK